MGKSLNDEPWYVKERKARKIGEQWGVDYKDFRTEARGTGHDESDYEAFEKAIFEKASGHYDTRRSIELAQAQGYEGADKLSSSLDNLESLQNAQDFFSQVHQDQGHKDNFDSIDDYAQVTNYLFDKDREKFSADLEGKWTEDIEEAVASGNATVGDNQQAKPIEYSDELKSAYKRNAEYEGTQRTGSTSSDIFKGKDESEVDNPTEFEAGQGFDQRNNAATSLLDKYKMDLTGSEGPAFM